MRVVMFYHSILSDWNHGNAHFLRGVAFELVRRGHEVVVYEPEDSWSRLNLERDHGPRPVARFAALYPGIQCARYDLGSLDLDQALDGADLVLVHEWNPAELVARVGRHRSRSRIGYRLLFHDTHHRAATAPEEMARYRLDSYDGVLAFGGVLRDLYLDRGWAGRAWTWHEAADVRLFRPRRSASKDGDLVWIGNWGDGERTAELQEFLLEPVRRLRLKAVAHGVRFSEEGLSALRRAKMEYRGWLANIDVPSVFSCFRATVHVPRRPYARALPGIPTIRVFEALACGIPLVCAPWEDAERLFTPGKDYLVAKSGADMVEALRSFIQDAALRSDFAAHGLKTILDRHTVAHRVNELLEIYADLTGDRKQSKRISAR
jgi:spore maturation protein CgeB